MKCTHAQGYVITKLTRLTHYIKNVIYAFVLKWTNRYALLT